MLACSQTLYFLFKVRRAKEKNEKKNKTQAKPMQDSVKLKNEKKKKLDGLLGKKNNNHKSRRRVTYFSFEGVFRRTKCPVVAQTQGYHLVCIWGSLVKFQGDGVVVKSMLCARADLLSFCTCAYPCLSKLNVSLKLMGGCARGGGVLPYITYTGMCRPTGS